MNAPVLYDAGGRAILPRKVRRQMSKQAQALLAGFTGANDGNLADWAFQPMDINKLLRNDLVKLRARSRDLARNDDTAIRFLAILRQNVLGHACIKLQAKNRLPSGKSDEKWNREIESQWDQFCSKRRYCGKAVAPSACGRMNMKQFAWLALLSKAVDGECFIQLLPGYEHNRHRFALRFLNPDLLDAGYSKDLPGGHRIEMGIELDKYDRAVAYHFDRSTASRKAEKEIIPASQIIHIYRHEFVGQLRGIPAFTGIMHKAKMLNGVHEAIVVGWRVAAAKMGFFSSSEPLEDGLGADEYGEDDRERFEEREIEAVPGSFDVLPYGYKLDTFDPDYPSSTYEAGHKVFMQQLSNGLNVSSPTLSNNYADVNYSSLRQALLEDREGWRCLQAEMIADFYQPIFDEWYRFGVDIARTITVAAAKRAVDPTIVWMPRGWPWVDPLKEVNAQLRAIHGRLRTRQSIMAETSGADFVDTVDEMSAEEQALLERGLAITEQGIKQGGSNG